MHITGTNVNHVYWDALQWLKVSGVHEESRNGPVLVSPGPVLLQYMNPTERVLFDPLRDANPYFHAMEALWMLAGRGDLEWPLYFNSNLSEFSDDGSSLNGAYGHRWRRYFYFDQLKMLVDHLKDNPKSRRAVLAMWDPDDLYLRNFSRDLPCNTHAYFDLRGGRLNMTVCNRSNDLVWGACGANAVHFSMLQEYLAAGLRRPVGTYYQFTNNLHLYTEQHKVLLDNTYSDWDLYEDRTVRVPLVDTELEQWDVDLTRFLSDPEGDTLYLNSFFNDVASPMYSSWADRKGGRNNGLLAAEAIRAEDWRVACINWIKRRENREQSKSVVQSVCS